MAQTKGIGDNVHAMSWGLNGEGRGRKESWAGDRDISYVSNLLRKPWHLHMHASKCAARDLG